MMSKKLKIMFKCLVYATQYRKLRCGFKHKKAIRSELNTKTHSGSVAKLE